ncbi:MAG: AraC family transcriptional regulator [Ruminiclostridium sp.]
MQIENGKELKIENLLSLRKKMTQAEANTEMMKIGKMFEEKGIKKNGPVITATFAIETIGGQALLDMEIFVPMDKKVELTGEYRFKALFHMVNAVYARHVGNPAMLQNTYNEMMAFIQQNDLQQITAGYNVTVKDMLPGISLDELVMDVYIGVNPNVL